MDSFTTRLTAVGMRKQCWNLTQSHAHATQLTVESMSLWSEFKSGSAR
jgi:hypothetical protein